MSGACTAVAVLNQVDPRALFDAMRAVARNSEFALHDTPDYGGMHMYRASCESAAARATVAVHFPAGGGLFNVNPDSRQPEPDAYALGEFRTSWEPGPNGRALTRRKHDGLLRELVPWLTSSGVRWLAAFEDDPWTAGQPAAGARS